MAPFSLGGRQEGHHLLRVMKAETADGGKMKLWKDLSKYIP